jgi:hypothetical protein
MYLAGDHKPLKDSVNLNENQKEIKKLIKTPKKTSL